jgi:hypothetical protein
MKLFRSKAIDIIKSLSKEEFLRLGKYLSSPFFNSNKNLTKLYKVLKGNYPDFETVKFNKEDVYKIIYGNSPYDDEKFRKLLSALYKELNKFECLLEDKPIHNRYLRNNFMPRSLTVIPCKVFRG